MPGKSWKGPSVALVLALALGASGGCSGDDGGGSGGALPQQLSALHLFTGDMALQQPADGVIPYDVNSVLFADLAGKYRFIKVPAGQTIHYDPAERWGFPVGSMVIKTFGYPHDFRDPSAGERIVETRILLREQTGWSAHVYLWNDAQTEATQLVAGTRVPVAWIDTDGQMQTLEYRVPNTNQCVTCHGRGAHESDVLGVRTMQLERDHDYGAGPVDQIDHLAMLGLFDTAPEPASMRARLEDPRGDGPLEARARAYLEANCAHCHRPGAEATSSGLFLNIETTDPAQLGVCKIPFAAGRGSGGRPFDIVPGHPDDSILVFRVESTEAGIKMPQIPIQLVDPDGVAVLREWITSLGDGCH